MDDFEQQTIIYKRLKDALENSLFLDKLVRRLTDENTILRAALQEARRGYYNILDLSLMPSREYDPDTRALIAKLDAALEYSGSEVAVETPAPTKAQGKDESVCPDCGWPKSEGDHAECVPF